MTATFTTDQLLRAYDNDLWLYDNGIFADEWPGHAAILSASEVMDLAARQIWGADYWERSDFAAERPDAVWEIEIDDTDYQY